MRMTRISAMQSDINITPLVDVCLVLLIIFMVVTPLMVTGMPVQLPTASTAGSLSRQPLNVTLNADHTLYVGSNVLRAEQLTGELQRVRAQSDRPVIVRADKTLAYGEVVGILDACRKAGFEQVGLAAQKQ